MLGTKRGRLVHAQQATGARHAATRRRELPSELLIGVVFAAWAILLLSAYIAGAVG